MELRRVRKASADDYANAKARAFKFAADCLVKADVTSLDDHARLQLGTVVIPLLIGRALKLENLENSKPKEAVKAADVRKDSLAALFAALEEA